MKLAALMLLMTLAAAAQSPRTHQDNLPDAPLVQQPEPFYKPRTSFKQVFQSKSFWIPEVAAFGLAVADAHHNNCSRIANAPCGGDIYRDALVPFAVLVPLHIITARFISPLIGWASCGYIATRHARGLATGVYP